MRVLLGFAGVGGQMLADKQSAACTLPGAGQEGFVVGLQLAGSLGSEAIWNSSFKSETYLQYLRICHVRG